MDNNQTTFLTDKIKGYLTKEAESVVVQLVEGGMDRDLAVILLETHWPDVKVYTINEESEA